MFNRLIPVILIHNEGVYKTQKFTNANYIGDPVNTIRIFNDLEVDEIFILDIDASLSSKDPNFELIANMASEAFMPLTYGGGVNSIETCKKLFKIGIDKISFNTALFEKPNFIREASEMFGAQAIVASLDYKPNFMGKNKIYSKVVKNKTIKMELSTAVQMAIELGAGEVLLQNVALDGQMSGLDLQTISEIAAQVEVPVVACGGLGALEHANKAFETDISGVAGGSFFVYKGKQRGILISYPNAHLFNGSA